MDRYRTYGALDDQPLNDGDTYFLGFWSRYQPTYLKPGQASYAGNMRMDRGTAKVRAGLKALSNDINLPNPALIVGGFSLAADVGVSTLTRVTTTATATTTTAHGYASTNYVNIRGAVETAYNGDQTITVTGATTFTYVVAGSPGTPATGTIFANKGPRVFDLTGYSQAIGSGDYADDNTNTEGIIIASQAKAYLYRYGVTTAIITYPAGETVTVGQPCCIVQFLNKVYMFRGYATSNAVPAAITSISRSVNTATVTTTAPHGLATGQWVTVAGATQYDYNIVAQITVTGASTYTYTVSNTPVTPATGTMTYRVVQPPLYWDQNTSTLAFQVVPTGSNAAGAPIIDIPPVDWGIFFKNRFVLPYTKDQLILSDIDDANSYDPSQNQFRIMPGTADWLIGAFPYQEARLLVLYRKSVHVILLDGTLLSIAQAFDITRNFGCIGRRTVANCGPYIVWLSDIGVVRMEISNELSLTNTAAPLSDPIQDKIQTINWAYAGNAVAVFWNNRYYLAVPTGSSTINNTILVYNFLNEAWESLDSYPGGFDVLNFHVISYNGTKRIHAVSSAGFVVLLEENNYDEFGAPGGLANYAIAGALNTRSYLANTYDPKRVRRFQLEANVATGDVFTGTYVLSNPDYSLAALSYTATATTDITLRTTVGRRGISGSLQVATTSGRPEFKAVLAEATVTTRGTYNLT